MTRATFLDRLDRALLVQAMTMLAVGAILVGYVASTTRTIKAAELERMRDSVAVRQVAGND